MEAQVKAITWVTVGLLAILVVINGVMAVQLVELRSQVSSLSGRVSAQATQVNQTIYEAINYMEAQLREIVNATNSSVASQVLEQSKYPVMIVDALNQTVVVPSRPTRVVTLDPAATEIVLALGAADSLVGVDNDSIYYLPPPYNSTIWSLFRSGAVADIGSTYSSPSVGKILALHPDLVIGTAGWGYNNYIASTLSQYGVPVLLLPSSESLGDIYRSIVMVGEALGLDRQASYLVDNITASVASLQLALSNVSPVNVTLILWINPTYVVGGYNFQNNMISLVNGVNVFQNFTGWPTISPEELVEANPCTIIVMSNGGLFNTSTLYGWLQSTVGSAYANICAIRSGRVYVIGGWYESVISEPSVLVPIALKLLAEILHPQAFNQTSLPTYITPQTLPVAEH